MRIRPPILFGAEPDCKSARPITTAEQWNFSSTTTTAAWRGELHEPAHMKGSISLVSSFLFPPGHTVAGVLIYSARGRDVQTPTRLREGAQESGSPPTLATAGRREPAPKFCAFLKALFPGVLEPPGNSTDDSPVLHDAMVHSAGSQEATERIE